MRFQIALHAANVLVQNALGVVEGIVDRRMNIGVAVVGVRLVADIDLLSFWQREVDMDLEERSRLRKLLMELGGLPMAAQVTNRTKRRGRVALLKTEN